jgi:Ferredoxin subunits of nitrite reductase and ring-hydroxylating dioxygenases
MAEAQWLDLGPVEQLQQKSLQQLTVGKTVIALSYANGEFGAISGVCNHVGGPLGKGCLEGDLIVCPWHRWRYDRKTGSGEPGYEEERVPGYEIKIENGHLWLNPTPLTKRHKLPHPALPLARPVKAERDPGAWRVLGVSTTVMEKNYPRYSTSETLLQAALDGAQQNHGAQTQLLRLNDLKFRNCEGYYSKSSHACTWPCSITQMDPNDGLTPVYEAMVHWADVILLATPIRWGAPSSLYFKMVERMNCIQNQITLFNKILIQNKVISFIITGGQDNIQAVAGEMLAFFSELGFMFPPFPYIAHSLGWEAENMERNMEFVQASAELKSGAIDLARRSVEMAERLCAAAKIVGDKMERAGRKAHRDKQNVKKPETVDHS